MSLVVDKYSLLNNFLISYEKILVGKPESLHHPKLQETLNKLAQDAQDDNEAAVRECLRVLAGNTCTVGKAL